MGKPKLRTIGKIAGIGGSIALESGIINTGNIMSQVKSTGIGSKLPDVNALASKATAGLQPQVDKMVSDNLDTSQLMGNLSTDTNEQMSQFNQASLSGVEALKGIFNNFL